MKFVDCKELSLKKVKIEGNVIGKFGTFEVEQTFINNTQNVLEVNYTFPIVETATIVGFDVNVGDKTLIGKCQEAKKAKKEYATNIVKGNSSYLLEEESENIFTITIGKLEKKEEVKIKIKYIDKFEVIDNSILLLIPTLVPPKYNSTITDKLEYGKVNYTVDFRINIANTYTIKNITSPTHKLNLSNDIKSTNIEVLNYDLSKDFKLNINLENELVSYAITSKARNGENIIYTSFMPEITDSYEDSEKEYIFLVDISGSMFGTKLEETKRAVIECLKQLDNGDKFNILVFESECTAMHICSLEYNEENLNKAIKFITNVQADGGTEILEAIIFALFEKHNDKVVLLFTDGEVGNEQEIITYVENNINKSRLFTFGIDDNVNSYFLRDLAKVGNGKCELITPKENISDKIIRTFARIQTPLLENLTIDYSKNKVIDEIRESNTLFNYEYFNAFSRTKNTNCDITLKGTILEKEYSWTIKKEEILNTNIDLEVLFAKEEIDRLENYIRNCNDNKKIKTYKKLIIKLSEKYNINSKYTSFLTIYERENKIFDVPKLENITLNSNSFRQNIGNTLQMFMGSSAEFDDCAECDYDIAIPEFRKNDVDDFYNSYDTVLHCPEMREAAIKFDSLPPKKQEEIINKASIKHTILKKTKEYYKEFIKNPRQSLVTYILFAIYSMTQEIKNFDFKKFGEILFENKEQAKKDAEIQELLYKLFKIINELDYNSPIKKKSKIYNKLFECLNIYTQKAILANLKYQITRKEVYYSDMMKIVNEDSIKENINSILWTHISEYY